MPRVAAQKSCPVNINPGIVSDCRCGQDLEVKDGADGFGGVSCKGGLLEFFGFGPGSGPVGHHQDVDVTVWPNSPMQLAPVEIRAEFEIRAGCDQVGHDAQNLAFYWVRSHTGDPNRAAASSGTNIQHHSASWQPSEPGQRPFCDTDSAVNLVPVEVEVARHRSRRVAGAASVCETLAGGEALGRLRKLHE